MKSEARQFRLLWGSAILIAIGLFSIALSFPPDSIPRVILGSASQFFLGMGFGAAVYRKLLKGEGHDH